MGDYHEIVRIPDGALAWVYLFSENQLEKVSSHWHRSLELAYICRGKADYNINGRVSSLQSGDLVLINSGDLHKCNIDAVSCEAINIMIPANYLTQFSPGGDMAFFRLNKDRASYGKLVKYCGELYHVFATRGRDAYAQLRINSIVSEIIYLLFSDFRSDGFAIHAIESKKYRDRCLEIIKYIEENFQDNISMKTLTSEFCLSKEHLSRVFREYMGSTFKKHLTLIRTFHAHKLLTTSDLTITQIAMDSGFSDSRAFISSFQKYYGTTPGRYRQKLYREVKILHGNEATKSVLFIPEEDLPDNTYTAKGLPLRR